MKVAVSCANAPDAMLAHEHRRFRVVPQVARDTRHVTDNGGEHGAVALGGQQHCQPGRGGYGEEKLAGCCTRPRLSQHAWMRDHAKKLVANAPGEKPGIASDAPGFEQRATPHMLRRVAICRVHQDIRIDDEQSAPLHRAKQFVAIGNVDEGAAAVERGQRRKLHRARSRAEQLSERHLDQFGHRAAAARRLAAQSRHDGIVNVERGLHMGNHTHNMGVRQLCYGDRQPPNAMAGRNYPSSVNVSMMLT